MPILGAVVTLAPPTSTSTRAHALAAVAAVPGVALVGGLAGARLPIVIETLRKQDDEGVFDALRAVPGVLMVDLAFADFSDLLAEELSP